MDGDGDEEELYNHLIKAHYINTIYILGGIEE